MADGNNAGGKLMKGGSFDANWLHCEAIETADI
jgi:hypothetical protein